MGNHVCYCYGILVGERFWLSQPKRRKTPKSSHLQPLFRVYKGLVVIVRKGCGVVGVSILRICDMK